MHTQKSMQIAGLNGVTVWTGESLGPQLCPVTLIYHIYTVLSYAYEMTTVPSYVLNEYINDNRVYELFKLVKNYINGS